METILTQTFYKEGELYYVESQHIDKSNSYRCINVSDNEDVQYLTKEEVYNFVDKKGEL